MRTQIRRAALVAAAATASSLLAAPALAGGVVPLTTEQVVPLLRFPTNAVAAPGDYTRLYITEKRGRIVVVNTKTQVTTSTPMLDIDSIVGGGGSTNNEQGLLGLAFHPDWQTNGYLYINYTNNSGNTVVARYTATSPETIDTGSAEVVITYSQPFSNHNAGWLGFGPDGYLYVASGDGGSGGDPGNRAQDITSQKLGKMMRLDVDGDDFPADPNRNYAVPSDNPFVGVTGDDELWAYGLRNPWKCAFDPATGDLVIADVGQNAREEINVQPASSTGGENYGWRCREGTINFNFSGSCSSQTFTEPIFDYTHSLGFSVTGGHVYRGCKIPSLDGHYFFADWGSSRIWTIDLDAATVVATQRQADLAPDTGSINRISAFGQDLLGEVYIVEHGTGFNGELFRVLPETQTVSDYDLDCDGDVDFDDLIAMLSVYGNCDGCREDIDGDHRVTFTELVGLLADFG